MRWSAEEDRILAARCNAQMKESGSDTVHDWTDIALALPNRNNKDCRKRWVNVVAGDIRKGQWTEEEDEALIDAVKRYLPYGWPAVAQRLQNRSPDQCAKRWQQSLNPELDHGEWTKEEDVILLEAVKAEGRSWVRIRDAYFPRRATNTIKNHFSMIRKRQESSGNHEHSREHSKRSRRSISDSPSKQIKKERSNSWTPPLESVPSVSFGSVSPSVSPISDTSDYLNAMPQVQLDVSGQPTHVDPKLVGGVSPSAVWTPNKEPQQQDFSAWFEEQTMDYNGAYFGSEQLFQSWNTDLAMDVDRPLPSSKDDVDDDSSDTDFQPSTPSSIGQASESDVSSNVSGSISPRAIRVLIQDPSAVVMGKLMDLVASHPNSVSLEMQSSALRAGG